MIRLLYLIFLGNVLLSTLTNALPYIRFRRQIIPNRNENLPYEGWAGGSNNPSGGSPGAFYGTGTNPNYGGVRPNTNNAQGGINVISYNHEYTHNNNNPNWNTQQQQYNQYNNNYNNQWQRPNNNNYNNQPNNRYPPGSQGWYATGGNYWYNKGQSLVPHAWILIIALLISIVCTL